MLMIKWVCNTNCTFCNFYETKWKIDEFKHFEELKIEIDELDSSRIKRVNIWIHWYEPTVFKYFFEILSYIKNKGFYTNLSTNWVLLENEDFTKKLSKVIDEVTITLYSSDDKEHNILTQNDDSYKIKLKAISKSLKYSIKVNLSILLLKPALSSLETIFDQISIFFDNPFFSKNVWITAPNAVMWEDRNRILIPSYSSIVLWLKSLLKENENLFIKNNIKLCLNNSIPRCIFDFDYPKNILSFPDKYLKENNKKIISSADSDKIFFEKCNSCNFLNKCNWLEKEYVKIYWSDEVVNLKKIENFFTLDWINTFLKNTLSKYKKEWIWFNTDYLDKSIKENRKLLSIPKNILNYSLKDVLIVNNKIWKIRFLNSIDEDFFIVNIDNKWPKTFFSLFEWNIKNIKIYNLIMVIMFKKFNL